MSLCICNDSSWLNNAEKRIRSKLQEWNLCIAKTVFGLGVVSLLAGIVVVASLPDSFPNTSKTCLPDRHNYLKCGQTEETVNSFISNVLEKKYNQIVERKKKIREEQFHQMDMPSSYSDIIPNMKPAAKLIGKEVQPNNTNEMVPIDTWINGRELVKKGGFLRQGVRYYKGRLVVPVPGTYFVYSFVEFYEPCLCIDGTPNVENRTDPIKHALFKYSVIGGENVEITGSAQSHKIAKNKFENVYSSHISTVVDLKAGDELSVQANNVPLLSKYARDNYFELVLIE